MNNKTVSYDTRLNPTAEYDTFEYAFDYFNDKLFGGRLPLVLLTYQHSKKFGGYYDHERFAEREGIEKTSEIALNPDKFEGRTDKDILSILAHEMAHLAQCFFGKPSRTGYHNGEWADMMESIGLMPSITGEPGGKRTGQHMSHYIIEAGPFDIACNALLQAGFKLTWQTRRLGDGKTVTKKIKTKYTCPDCGANAWGKPDLNLLCGDCKQVLLVDL